MRITFLHRHCCAGETEGKLCNNICEQKIRIHSGFCLCDINIFFGVRTGLAPEETKQADNRFSLRGVSCAHDTNTTPNIVSLAIHASVLRL